MIIGAASIVILFSKNIKLTITNVAPVGYYQYLKNMSNP
jgi:hypothetical protein